MMIYRFTVGQISVLEKLMKGPPNTVFLVIQIQGWYKRYL